MAIGVAHNGSVSTSRWRSVTSGALSLARTISDRLGMPTKPQPHVIPCAQNIRSGASSYDIGHTVALPLVRHPRRRVRDAATWRPRIDETGRAARRHRCLLACPIELDIDPADLQL